MKAEELIISHKEDLQSLGVKHLIIYGSHAHENERIGSDIDIIIDLKDIRQFFNVRKYLMNLLNLKIDMTMLQDISPKYRRYVFINHKEVF